MLRHPPPHLRPEEKASTPAFRTLARRLLREMADYDPELAGQLRERHAERLDQGVRRNGRSRDG